MKKKAIIALCIFLLLFFVSSCGYRQLTNKATLSPKISKLKLVSDNEITNTMQRAFLRILTPETLVKETAAPPFWQLKLKKQHELTTTISSSANSHIVVKKVEITLCFSLVSPKGKSIITNNCLTQSTSYPFDSNELLSFEIQSKSHLRRLEEQLAQRTIDLINLKTINLE